MKLDIVEFAYQIIEMHDKIRNLEIENERLHKYKEDYNSLLDSSIEHSQAMIANTLKLVLTPGVVEACEGL